MKIVSLTIGLLLIAALAFAEPIYTEGVSKQVEITENGHVQVRKAIRTYKDGVEVGKTYQRHVLAPGVDTSEEVKKVKDIAEVAWTEEVIEDYEALLEKIKRDRDR